ncbi:F-box only protein 22-like [Octopus vulgaris]|uniref:F-box only protein 22-like n=3 Tax=Octopus TaxID=6643 RepID=A0AA36ARR5_OCTVU|nr:F-box only protein 22 isoform X1 [Octopus sinensis]CAI9720027.1 F-box only protein 22-like [Octopus vulgaris]
MVDCSKTCSSAGFVLTKIPLITKKVLSFLPAKTLNSCARVCKSWNFVAEQIKRKRQKLSWNFYVCEEDENNDMLATEIRNLFQEIWHEPVNFIGFCSSTLFDEPLKIPSNHMTRFHRTAKRMRLDIGNFLKQLLPSFCNFLAISADGVVGTNSEANKSFEIENKKSLSFLLIPKLENLQIHSFTIDIHTYTTQVDDILGPGTNHIPEDVKAILYFCNEPLCPPDIGYTLMQYFPESVLVGGFVDNLICPQKCLNDSGGQSDPSLLCIAFSGARLRVASVLIEEHINSKEEVEANIRKLKNCKLPEEQSFAFMFTCIGRGFHHYGVSNVESAVFRQFFPKTPLVGFFGTGEVGFTHLPSEGNVCENGKVDNNRTLPKLYHTYTTIICLLSVV